MKTLLTLAFATALSTTAAFGQSHGHINAGAKNTNSTPGINSGDALFMYFESGTNLTTLTYNSGGGVSGGDGYSWNGYTTFTALHQSTISGSPSGYDALGAVSGSFLTINLVGVTGPAGAKFAFYESGGTDPLWVYQIGTGFLSGDGKITLTQQTYFEGSPEDGIPSDPFGHIHGRTLAVDTSGSFTATWVLHDTQSATTGMQDSAPFTSSFSAAAVPEPATWLLIAIAAGALIVFHKRHRTGASD